MFLTLVLQFRNLAIPFIAKIQKLIYEVLAFIFLEQAYGQQSYGTYGQPTDVSYTQAQTTATYGQTAYATSYGQPPTVEGTSTGLTILLILAWEMLSILSNPVMLIL